MYGDFVDGADLYGLNAGISDVRIPVAKHVEREVEEDNQMKKLHVLLATKGAFPASAMWNVCGSRGIGSSSVVFRAQKEQLDLKAKIWNQHRSPKWKGMQSYW